MLLALKEEGALGQRMWASCFQKPEKAKKQILP